MKFIDKKKIHNNCGLLHFIRLNIPNYISASKWTPLLRMQKYKGEFYGWSLQLLVLLHFHVFLLQLHWSVSSKLGCYFVFGDELTYPLHPRTSSPMGWGQGCELFLLQIQLQNTRRCCLWSSLNSWHLWNLNGFTFSSFRKILRVSSIEKI